MPTRKQIDKAFITTKAKKNSTIRKVKKSDIVHALLNELEYCIKNYILRGYDEIPYTIIAEVINDEISIKNLVRGEDVSKFAEDSLRFIRSTSGFRIKPSSYYKNQTNLFRNELKEYMKENININNIIAEMKLIKEPSNRQTWHILKSSSFTYIKINKRKKLIFSINN